MTSKIPLWGLEGDIPEEFYGQFAKPKQAGQESGDTNPESKGSVDKQMTSFHNNDPPTVTVRVENAYKTKHVLLRACNKYPSCQLNGHRPKSYETIGSVAGLFFNIY